MEACFYVQEFFLCENELEYHFYKRPLNRNSVHCMLFIFTQNLAESLPFLFDPRSLKGIAGSFLFKRESRIKKNPYNAILYSLFCEHQQQNNN